MIRYCIQVSERYFANTSSFAMAHVCAPLRSLLNRRSDTTVTVCGSRHQSGHQFCTRIAALASGFSQDLQICHGDRVALLGLSTDLFFEALLAVFSCGAVAAPLNWRWSTNEAAHAVDVCGATVLVVDFWAEELARDLIKEWPSLRAVVLLGDGDNTSLLKQLTITSGSLIAKHWGAEQNFVRPTHGHALICFTSGTTGKPKAVTISHEALHFQSMVKLAVCRYKFDDVFLHTAPMFHIGGISSGMAMLMAGARHVFLPKFSAKSTAGLAIQHHATALIAVPTMIVDLGKISKELLSVQTVLIGGGGMNSTQMKIAYKVFPRAQIFTAYGMTEACSSITFHGPFSLHTPHENFQEGHAGFPAPGIEICISGKDPKDEGEIFTRGPQLMRGYWGNEKETSATLTPNGWLRTGDIGCWAQDGGLLLLGRAKDMIKSGGENIYAAEVESALGSHPGVKQVAVVGVRDPRLGEIAAALICLDDEWSWRGESIVERKDTSSIDWNPKHRTHQKHLSADLLSNDCSSKGLSRYKIPKLWVVQQEELPTTSLGKVNKSIVRTMLNNIQQRRSQPPRSML